jgi:hypothetical protein
VPHYYIYPVRRTALFPSNDVSHETKKNLPTRKNPAGVPSEQTATPIGEVALGMACTKDTTCVDIGKFENVVCELVCCIVPLFTVNSDTEKKQSKEVQQNNSKTEVEIEILRPMVWVY